jgi:soluble lytic murein transglycosylase
MIPAVAILAAALGAAPAGGPVATRAAVPDVVSDADVRPILDAPDLAEARAASRASRHGDVAGALAGRREPEARLRRAEALLRSGDGAAARRALEGLGGEIPEVADRVDAMDAQAAEAAGDAAAAAAAWARVPPGSTQWPEARLALARLASAAGRLDEAEEALRPLLDWPAPADLSRPDPGARALLAAGRVRAGRPDGAAEARRLLVECWARHPLSPQAAECRSRREALPAPHAAPPGDEESIVRAEALLEWNRNELAHSEAARVGASLAPPGPEAPLACRAAFVRGKALRKQRQYRRAADELEPVVERCADASLRARALYLLAIARTNLSIADGIATYRRFAEAYPEHAQADDALFFAADLLAREGDLAGADALLARLAAGYPQGDFRPEALFRRAWIARRQGRLGDAVEQLARAEEEFRELDPYEHARAAYWRARVLAERGGRGDRAQARAAWDELVARYPADYYGLLAGARLAESGAGKGRGRGPAAGRAPEPARGEPSGFRYRAGPLSADPHLRAAIVLLRADLPGAAAEELAAVDRRALTGVGDGVEPLLLLAELMDRAGDVRSAHGLLRSRGRQILRQPPEGMGARVWQVAYPPAWRPDVLRWAPPAGVPPDLLQALMREESALDPAVVSVAGAVGLTQLMPSTAEQAARRLRLPRPSAADLADPALNIRLGAVHLGDLLRRFGGSAPLALAAYNAGETPVRGWWRSRGALPLDEFVEEIPLQETRGYVKRVLRSYAAYRMLYGRPGELPVALGQRLPPPP